MKVEIWSDVVCPWCFVGKRNFEAALAGFEHAGDVDVHWRSYELDPRAPREREGDYASRISRKYGVSLGEAKARIARIVSAGADAGIEFNFDRSRPGNTFDAHRLLHFAATRGRQGELKERLLLATFTEGEPIGDHDTLAKLAVDTGLDPQDVAGVLAGDAFAADVRADEATAQELGATGVPFFLFEGKYGLSGAHPPQAFARVLAKVWEETRPAVEMLDGGSAAAESCDDGECAL